jgi:hypothetical protein
MRTRLGLPRLVILLPLVVLLALLAACQPPAPHAQARTREAASHDLSIDEQHGGHTLQRHVGRSDDELRQRLQREQGISAASTYTDRATAERAIAAALQQNADKIRRWVERGPRRPNLVIDYRDLKIPLGRTMNRGAADSVPCDRAILVLRADEDSYYVLTSYPECRS